MEELFNKFQEQINLVVNNLAEVVIYVDNNMNIIWANKKASEASGRCLEDLINQTCYKAFCGLKDPCKDCPAPRALVTGQVTTSEITTFNEKNIITASPVFNEEKEKIGIVISSLDITERKKVEEALVVSEEKYRTLLENIPIGVYRTNPGQYGKTLMANKAFLNIFGYNSFDEIKDLKASDFYQEPSERKDVSQLFLTHEKVEGLELALKKKDGTPIWVRSNSRLVYGEGEEVYFDCTLEDITYRKQYEEQLKFLSLNDPLTELYNRTYFEEELKRLSKSTEYPITLLSLDINGLRIINDNLGHQQGSQLLKNCASLLKETFRNTDFVARIGGDEFGLIMPKTDQRIAEELICKLKSNIVQWNKNNPLLPLSISVGAATEEKANSLEKTFKVAEENMHYQKLFEKKSNRSQVIETLMIALNERDYMTEGHGRRLADFAVKIGEKIKLSSNQLTNIAVLAQVHDLGKVGIPDHILFKPGALTKEEWEIMRQHPEKGYRIASASPDLEKIAELILKHHERWDGKGYPLEIGGEDIPIECRILSIVDAYDAMTSHRPYSKARSKDEAMEEIKVCSGTQFDPDIAEIALEILMEEQKEEKH